MSRLWNDPALLDAMRTALRTGETDESVARRFNVNGTTAARARIFVKGEQSGKGGPPAPGRRTRLRNWNGETNATRQRGLKGRKKTDHYLELLNLQLLISQLSSVLEGVNVSDYGLDDMSLLRVNEVHDDLLSLATWVDRATSAVQGWLGDADIRKKIAILRDTAGRTEEEAKVFARLADKLERKLQNRLISG